MFHRILIAFDNTPPARYAVEVGAETAALAGAAVALIHVLNPPATFVAEAPMEFLAEQDENAARSAATALRELHARFRPGTVIHDMIERGRPADQIVAAAKRWHADLVVVGTHNRHALSHFLLGSTAEAVVRHAPCPVLVARHPDPAPTGDDRPTATSTPNAPAAPVPVPHPVPNPTH